MQPLFATMTNAKLVVSVVFEASGNLVAYDALKIKQWESGTTVSVTSKAQLFLGDDGNLVPISFLHFNGNRYLKARPFFFNYLKKRAIFLEQLLLRWLLSMFYCSPGDLRYSDQKSCLDIRN